MHGKPYHLLHTCANFAVPCPPQEKARASAATISLRHVFHPQIHLRTGRLSQQTLPRWGEGKRCGVPPPCALIRGIAPSPGFELKVPYRQTISRWGKNGKDGCRLCRKGGLLPLAEGLASGKKRKTPQEKACFLLGCFLRLPIERNIHFAIYLC